MTRVIVLGFDALDPRLCQQWMDSGDLPNLAKLAASGTFRPLATTVPCQSPVAWRTFATGCNPGKHGIFDFLQRRPGSYLPEFALVERGERELLPAAQRAAVAFTAGAMGGVACAAAARRAKLSRRALIGLAAGLPLAAAGFGALERWLPKVLPTAVNRAGGEPFWAALGARGLRTTALWMPAEFPAREYPGARVVGGLGTPDARGTNGTYTLFTTAPGISGDTEMGGRVSAIAFVDGVAHADLLGPPDPLDGEGRPLHSPVELRRTPGGLAITCGGTTVTLAPGGWSDWVDIELRSGPLVRLAARLRFHLVQVEPEIALYASPLNLDPARMPPGLALSAPAAFAGELRERHGFFKTLGWPTETWALTEERISDDAYLDDFADTFGRQRAIALAEIARCDWDCFTAVFLPTDHIQHTFWRGLDPQHPRYESDAPDRVRHAIRDAYRDCDRMVGEVLATKPADVALVVLSDHGFHPWRIAVNLNTWLHERGWLALKAGAASADKSLLDLQPDGLFFEHVDWFATRAYSLGLGNIHLNLAGREPEGIVKPGGEDEAVLARLERDLLAWRDPQGQPVVRSVYRGSNLYHGPYAAEGADLLVGFHPGYRVSWQTCLGGAPPGVFAPNARKWSGDHCSLDPAITPGVLFCDRPISAEAPGIIDAAPSILRLLGVEVPSDMDGRPWW